MKTRSCLAHLACGSPAASRALDIDPTEYADPLFGVGSATSAGPTLPSGSIHPSPETLEKDCGGYTRNQPIIGFGHTFISGAGGVKCYGNYLLAPMVDKLETDNKKRASFAVSGSEIARCYEYSVELDNGIKSRCTPSHNAAIHDIIYPSGKEAILFLDVAHKLDTDACMKHGKISIDPANKAISGGGLYTGNWNQHAWEMYFSLRFDSDFTEIGIHKGDSLTPLPNSAISEVEIAPFERFGVYIKFGQSNSDKNVKAKIAISFVSADAAGRFLSSEIPDFDYEKVKNSARNRWRETLGVIELKTKDTALLRRFYTAMYHMNIQPRDRTSDHGRWDDFHTIWDSWKTVFPMYSLLYPDRMGHIVDSFIDRANYNEAVGNGIVVADEFSTAHEFLAGQGGNDADNAISDAYLKGVPLHKHNWSEAYRVLKRSATMMRSPEYIERGFATNNAMTVTGLPYTHRFKSAAATMGFAFNDKAISRVAKELGSSEEYEYYEKRSANWLNVWNSANESEGFYGFPQSPREDGSFETGFDAHKGYNAHFYEATGWDASYINYNDVPRLVKAMGGAELFTKRLLWACEHSVNYYNDDEGAEGYLNFTNEPSFHIPWLFCTDEIKRPDLAAKVIDQIIDRFSGKNDYPGDEDNGGMSSYYVFLMCGFFPYATTENYYLHGTRVEEITFRLGNGRDFKVTGENIGDKNIYVQSATWRGQALNVCKLTHADILSGGELHFVMGSSPSNWGTK